jgi:hypothetical protein
LTSLSPCGSMSVSTAESPGNGTTWLVGQNGMAIPEPFVESFLSNNHANLATVHWGDHFEMYATDRSPRDDAKLIRRVEVAQPAEAIHRSSESGSQVPATYFHASRGRSLSEDYHKFPRSLPACAPGIPSSARDHSLSPGSPHALSSSGRDPRATEILWFKFRGFGTVPHKAAWADFIRRRKHQVFTTPQLPNEKAQTSMTPSRAFK